MVWITVEEVLNRWTGGDAPSATDPVLLTLLDDAEAIVLRQYPAIQVRLDDLSLDARLLKMVMAGMIQRAYLTAHDNRANWSYASGPFSESAGAASTKRGLYLTDDDISLLAPTNAGNKAFSVNMDVAPGRFSGLALQGPGWYNGYWYSGNGEYCD